MENKICECGCGREIIKKKGEGIETYERRKFFSRDCHKGRKGKSAINIVREGKREPAIVHRCIDKFLYGRAA